MKTRLFEFDLVKAILILVMVASHSLEVIFSKGYGDFAFCADSGFSVFIEDFVFLFGAFGFMVVMGAQISVVGVREPARQIRRGCALLFARPDGDSQTALMIRFLLGSMRVGDQQYSPKQYRQLPLPRGGGLSVWNGLFCFRFMRLQIF